jgi:hypothetical protein
MPHQRVGAPNPPSEPETVARLGSTHKHSQPPGFVWTEGGDRAGMHVWSSEYHLTAHTDALAIDALAVFSP